MADMKLGFKMSLDASDARKTMQETFKKTRGIAETPQAEKAVGTSAISWKPGAATDAKPMTSAEGLNKNAGGMLAKLRSSVKGFGSELEKTAVSKLGSGKIMSFFSKAGPYGVALAGLASVIAAPFMKSLTGGVLRVREEWKRASETLENSDQRRAANRLLMNMESERLGKKIAALFYRIFPDFNGRVAKIFRGISGFIDKIAPALGKLSDAFWSVAGVVGKIFGAIWTGVKSVLGLLAKIPVVGNLFKAGTRDKQLQQWSDTYTGRNNGGTFQSAEGLWKSLATGAARVNPGLEQQKAINRTLAESHKTQSDALTVQKDIRSVLASIAAGNITRAVNKSENTKFAVAAEG